ncbi:thymidylate synthase (plasmid) [Bacillus cereus 03BB108]|uniref:Thymidylate synthase n=1 Tax=Bacillus cereus 03BB108 TaxID=451709 RepID=A0AAN0SRB4_BACCE|nr:thymidylate synthase [Bacillus cereus 03BB108]
MELFKKNVLEDDDFSNKYGYLGNVYGKQWRACKATTGDTKKINRILLTKGLS